MRNAKRKTRNAKRETGITKSRFAIEVRVIFSAAHALRLLGGREEPLHGHDFSVTVRVGCDALDAIGTVMDFHEVEAALEEVVGGWRNRNLNECEPFRVGGEGVNPSAERIAEVVGDRMCAAIGDGSGRGVRVVEVRVTEAAGCLAIWMAG